MQPMRPFAMLSCLLVVCASAILHSSSPTRTGQAYAAAVVAAEPTVQCLYLPLIRRPTAGSAAQGAQPAQAGLGCPQPIGALSGTVLARPTYPETVTVAQPRRYLLILDASGSMNLDFNGQGKVLGATTQCVPGPPGFPPVQADCTGPGNAWTPLEERRIYVAKQSFITLIGQLNLPGNPGYNAALPPDEVYLIWFNQSISPSQVRGPSSDLATLTSWVVDAGKTQDDPYRTAGGTNGAGALYRAGQILASAAPTITYQDQNYTYDQRVIFLTDGVQNFFLNLQTSGLAGVQSSASTYPADSPCRALGSQVLDNAPCQTNAFGGVYNGFDRPITELIDQAQSLFAQAEIYVLAMAFLDTRGLSEITSVPQNYFELPSLSIDAGGRTNVDTAASSIVASGMLGACRAKSEAQISTVAPERAPEGVALAAGSYGVITATNPLNASVVISAPIVLDPTTGALSYSFTEIVENRYDLSAVIYYKGRDGVTRPYTTLLDRELANMGTSQPLTITRNITTSLDLSLVFTGDVCAGP